MPENCVDCCAIYHYCVKWAHDSILQKKKLHFRAFKELTQSRVASEGWNQNLKPSFQPQDWISSTFYSFIHLLESPFKCYL